MAIGYRPTRKAPVRIHRDGLFDELGLVPRPFAPAVASLFCLRADPAGSAATTLVGNVAAGESVIKCPSPLNVPKYIHTIMAAIENVKMSISTFKMTDSPWAMDKLGLYRDRDSPKSIGG
jgi:hypothetical protein